MYYRTSEDQLYNYEYINIAILFHRNSHGKLWFSGITKLSLDGAKKSTIKLLKDSLMTVEKSQKDDQVVIQPRGLVADCTYILSVTH